ncbi:Uncharacterised protein [Mycobacterium tuberculosis]|nr:Uncharacterised protein [Mycobacterium tuberculosis]
MAECSLPPMAYTARPKGVQCAMKIAASSTATAITALIDTEASPQTGMRICETSE